MVKPPRGAHYLPAPVAPSTIAQQPTQGEYRIGFVDVPTMNSLWNPNAPRYNVLCRLVHVTNASLQIGYCQMMISFAFSVFFGYHYMMAVSGNLSTHHWINTYTARYISQLLFAVSVQLILVVVMIHGVRNERRSLLLPYIGYAIVAILAGCAQLGSDFLSIDRRIAAHDAKTQSSSQFAGHLIGTFIHAWCLSVIIRCYAFLGEKKVARQISEQLAATHAAFQYSDQLMHHVVEPPAYVDVVRGDGGASSMPPPPCDAAPAYTPRAPSAAAATAVECALSPPPTAADATTTTTTNDESKQPI